MMDQQEATPWGAQRPLPRLQTPDRSQADPNPKTLDELIPEEDPARLTWELVEDLDMMTLYETIKAVEGHPGRPAIDPKVLVALWAYATVEGVASARRLAKLCYRDDAFKWLRGGVDVNYHTLDTLVITGVDVINAGSDGGQMDPMLQRIESQQGQVPDEYYVDGGFSVKEDIDKVSQRGATVYAPVKQAKKKQQEGKDPYAPQKRDTPQVAAWRERMGTEQAQVKYRQRSKCEWPNAVCRNRNLQQFTVRGLAKVRAVVLWYVLVHDLLRAVALRAERAETTT